MPIMFTYADQTLDVDDIPMSVYGEIEAKTKVPWYDLTVSPARHAVASELLAQECAKILGIDDLPVMTPKLLVQVFKSVKTPNTPAEYSDGMPDPKVPDSDPETT